MCRSPDRRRAVAAVLALLLSLQSFVGSFLRPPVALAAPLELCTGAGLASLAAEPEGAPGEVDRPSCLLCLLPAATGPVAPPDLPLPFPASRACDPLPGGPVALAASPSPSWPRAPPRG